MNINSHFNKLMITLATSCFGMTSFAVVIPAGDKPGAQIQKPSKPFLTALPTLGPKVDDQTAPQKTLSKAHKIAHTFLIKKVEVLGLSEHSKISSIDLNTLAEKLRLKWSDNTGKLSINQLHHIAATLTQYMRKQGYILTRVYLPPQKINQERFVRFRVREAMLGQVTVIDNRVYSKSQLIEPFNNLMGKPILASQIERALVTLNGYPGLRLKAIFKQGKKPGQTDIVLKVLSSHQVNVRLGADNYGTKSTGRFRSIVSASLYNLTGGADDFEVDYIQKYTPDNSEFFQGSYSRQLIWPWTRFLMSYGYSKYSLGHDLAGQNIGGNSDIAQALIQQYVHQSRDSKAYFDVGLTHDIGILKQNNTTLNKDKITFSTLAFVMQNAFTSLNAYSFLRLSWNHGFNDFLGSMGKAPDGGIYPARQGANGEYATGQFNTEDIYLHLIQAPFQYSLITFNLNGQFSDDLLTSFSQLTFGGYNNMSAYQTNEFLADKGFKTGLMWELPIPGLINTPFFHTSYKWGNMLHIAPFTEYAAGWVNDATGNDKRHITLADYGIKLLFEIGQHLQLEGVAARRYGGTTAPADNEKERFWVGLNYAYDGF